MDTFIIILLLAVIALILAYMGYGRFKKEKKKKDPEAYIDGLRALLDGREEEAFTKFREVVSDDSDNIDAYLRIGAILRNYNKADKALQVHQDLTIRHGLNAETKVAVLKELAKDFISLKEYESARNALQEILATDGDNGWALDKMLEVHIGNDDWNAAFEVKEKLLKAQGIKSKSQLAIFKFFQGRELFSKKDYHKARVIFKDAINFDANCVAAYMHIGDSYMAENRVDDAVAIWRKMLSIVPDEAHLVLNRLKKALFEIGKFGEISDVCQDILDKSPQNLEALINLADYYNKKGEANRAVELLKRAFEEHPDARRPSIHLAKLYLANSESNSLKDLLNRLDERFQMSEKEFYCKKCGYKSASKIWLCPDCKAIDSFLV